MTTTTTPLRHWTRDDAAAYVRDVGEALAMAGKPPTRENTEHFFRIILADILLDDHGQKRPTTFMICLREGHATGMRKRAAWRRS